jgi:hypothetical protein
MRAKLKNENPRFICVCVSVMEYMRIRVLDLVYGMSEIDDAKGMSVDDVSKLKYSFLSLSPILLRRFFFKKKKKTVSVLIFKNFNHYF